MRYATRKRDQRGKATRRLRSGLGSGGFTLIELLASMLLIAILMGISAYAFRQTAESNALGLAKNALLNYAKFARGYAIANNVETTLAINPFNGRFEIWYLNPPSQGGAPWDPVNSDDACAFAPVLDAGARLPVDGSGRPMAAVSPIDYGDATYRPPATDGAERNIDNLTWAAVSFNGEGQLVVRTRRIATRTFTKRDGTTRAQAERNRLIDETPDLTLVPLVSAAPTGDTPITSAAGFVISDASKMRQILSGSDQPGDLVNKWLMLTRIDQPYAGFVNMVVLNRYSGHELGGGR